MSSRWKCWPHRWHASAKGAGFVTISECDSHAVTDAESGPVAGKGNGEQSLAGKFCGRLKQGWLLIAYHNLLTPAGLQDPPRPQVRSTSSSLLYAWRRDLGGTAIIYGKKNVVFLYAWRRDFGWNRMTRRASHRKACFHTPGGVTLVGTDELGVLHNHPVGVSIRLAA
jgi:hypothetical protein